MQKNSLFQNKKIKVSFSEKAYDKKPTSAEIPLISLKILKNKTQINSMEDFAEKLTNGYAVVLADMKTTMMSISGINSQYIFMLDFDNKDKDNLYTIKDLKSDKWMLENASFFYRTYNDGKDNVDRFRVVFVLDKPKQYQSEIKRVYKELFERYPQSDTTVGQSNRIFFGGMSGYEEINFDNYLNDDKMYEESLELEISTYVSNGEIIDIHTPNYLLFKFKKYDILKQKFGNKYSSIFTDNISAINYFRSIDMTEFLELPTQAPFLDILHKENNPSASVYYFTETNTYFYKCFSESKEFHGDVITLIGHLIYSYSKLDTVFQLMEVTNSKIEYESNLRKEKELATVFVNDLMSGNLNKSYPELYHYLKRYKIEVDSIIRIFYDYTYTDNITKEVKFINFISLQQLAGLISNRAEKKITVNKVNTVVNLLALVDIIRKLPREEVPKNLLEMINKNQKNKQYLRGSNVYTPLSVKEEDMYYKNEIAKILKEHQLPISSLSFKSVYSIFGIDKANSVFEQAYEPLIKNNLVYMDEDTKSLPKSTITLRNNAINIIMEELDKNNYVYEMDIITKLARKSSKTKVSITKSYNEIRSDIYITYGLVRKRMTKSLAKEYNIVKYTTNKIIIIRE